MSPVITSTSVPSQGNVIYFGTNCSLMMNSINSTRVKAPDISVTGGPSPAVRIKVVGQSSSRNAHCWMKSGLPIATRSDSKNWNLHHSVKIATGNVLTLHKPGYQVAVSGEMGRLGIDVAGLTEARIIGNGRTIVEDSTILFSGGSTHEQGVALMLRNSASKSIKSWSPISPRLLLARLAHRHGHLSILVVYAPTEDSLDTVKDQFYDQLQSVVNSIPHHDQLVLIRDFNAVSGTDQTGFEQVVGNHGSGTPNDNSLRLLTFCAAHGLSILGSWFQHRNIHRFTWTSNDKRTTKELSK